MLRELLFKKSITTFTSLFRSILSSSISFAVDFFILILLVEIFNIYYIYSAIFSFIIGTSVNYFISIRWVFGTRKISNIKIEYLLFIIIGGVCFILNILTIYFFTEYIGVHYLLSKIISGGAIFLISFLGRKLIIFK